MLTVQEFKQLLSVVGEPVVYTCAKDEMITASINAIVQPINARDEGLINAYGVGSKTVQIAVGDTPIAPVKFDTILTQNERLVLDTVITQHTRGTGTPSYYICYVRGK